MRNVALLTAAVLVVACGSSSSDAPAEAPPAAAPAPEWVMPDVQGVEALEDENPDPNIVEVTLAADRVKTSFSPGTTASAYAYNGLLPGPLLRAKVGDEVIVHFTNNLSEPTTIHWHGLRIPSEMDGTPRVQEPVKPGEQFTYRFRVPDAGSFWYHPHLRADVQVEKGLYAPLVVFDPKDPQFDAERFLLLDDIRLEENGSISPPSSMDGMMSGRFGNTLLTNGRPSKEVTGDVEQGTVERWRIVNTANARTMIVGLEGAYFRVIGTDGGLLPEPYLTNKLSVAIGQRYDLEVTYDQPGTARLLSYVETQDDSGKVTTVSLPAFTVNVAASDKTPRDLVYQTVTRPDRAADVKATITLAADGTNDMPWTINGKSMSTDPLFTWNEGATVELTIENKIQIEHPIHLHGQFFEILGDAKQPGLKDVVLLPPNATVKVRAYIDNPGRWMVHCHILEHAEMGMMGELVVTPKNGASPEPASAAPMSH
jgi:FtsP/CotA-like multicopper oxidase with cupredoxin domain